MRDASRWWFDFGRQVRIVSVSRLSSARATGVRFGRNTRNSAFSLAFTGHPFVPSSVESPIGYSSRRYTRAVWIGYTHRGSCAAQRTRACGAELCNFSLFLSCHSAGIHGSRNRDASAYSRVYFQHRLLLKIVEIEWNRSGIARNRTLALTRPWHR